MPTGKAGSGQLLAFLLRHRGAPEAFQSGDWQGKKAGPQHLLPAVWCSGGGVWAEPGAPPASWVLVSRWAVLRPRQEGWQWEDMFPGWGA